jgi:transposase
MASADWERLMADEHQRDLTQLKQLRTFLEHVGGWEGFEVASVTTEETLEPDVFGLTAPRLIIELRPKPDVPKRCSRCGAVVGEIHDGSLRRVRDLPLWDHDTWLIVPRARLQCPRCGPTVEAVTWLDRYQRMTKRLVDKIAGLAQVLPLKTVARLVGVGWDTVKQIDQRALAARLGPVDLTGVRQIAIDEFALHRGHRYATIVVEVATKRVLWLAQGRDGAALDGFFTALGPAGCQRLEAVVLDLWRPYLKAVRTHCPHAAIVYDGFHAIARYATEVLDRVRLDETNRLQRPQRDHQRRHAEVIRQVIKGTRWLLLRNRAHLRSRAERVRLRELLAANRALFIVYVLKDDLQHLWRHHSPTAARRAWRDWYTRAMASGLAPLQRFARHLAVAADYIVNHARYPLHTGLLEGMNNKIKVLKRMAYGYRDDAYFFLKIRAAFPGIPG